MPTYEGYGDSIVKPHPFRQGTIKGMKDGGVDTCTRCFAKRDHPAHRASAIYANSERKNGCDTTKNGVQCTKSLGHGMGHSFRGTPRSGHFG